MTPLMKEFPEPRRGTILPVRGGSLTRVISSWSSWSPRATEHRQTRDAIISERPSIIITSANILEKLGMRYRDGPPFNRSARALNRALGAPVLGRAEGRLPSVLAS